MSDITRPATPRMAARQTRFELLDGLRGIAAAAVMLFHYADQAGLSWVRGAWAAVDLFFVLSGLVIAHSYGQKILDGMAFARFAAVRLIRLTPLYLLGLALGVVGALIYVASTAAPALTYRQVAVAAVLELFYLPVFHFGEPRFLNNAVFPLNLPAWSLFFELAVNALFFAYVWRLRRYADVLIVASAGLCLVLFTLLEGDVAPGAVSSTFLWGFPRVIAMFFAGAGIVQLRLEQRPARPLLAVAVTVLGLAGFFATDDRLAMWNSLIVLPAAVMLLAPVQVAAWGRRACRWLGEMSYPLYILHVPLGMIIFLATPIRQLPAVAQVLLASGVAILVALAMAGVDRRVRAALQARWVPDGGR